MTPRQLSVKCTGMRIIVSWCSIGGIKDLFKSE